MIRAQGLRLATVVLAVAGLAAACTSTPEPRSQAAIRNDFERDKERCWLSSTRGMSFACADGPCTIALPERLEFERCMEERGWETDGELDS